AGLSLGEICPRAEEISLEQGAGRVFKAERVEIPRGYRLRPARLQAVAHDHFRHVRGVLEHEAHHLARLLAETIENEVRIQGWLLHHRAIDREVGTGPDQGGLGESRPVGAEYPDGIELSGVRPSHDVE